MTIDKDNCEITMYVCDDCQVVSPHAGICMECFENLQPLNFIPTFYATYAKRVAYILAILLILSNVWRLL